MSKAYPSNLTRVQYEFFSKMIPQPKPGGRQREVDMWSVLNAIFYVLLEGVRWRSLPGDFPLLSNFMGIGSAFAKLSKLTCLIDCKIWSRIFNNRYSPRLN